MVRYKSVRAAAPFTIECVGGDGRRTVLRREMPSFQHARLQASEVARLTGWWVVLRDQGGEAVEAWNDGTSPEADQPERA